MLQNIREKTSGWIATVILGTIIVIFGLGFGIQDYVTAQQLNYVVKISADASIPGFRRPSVEISPNEFETRFRQVRQREMEEKGEAFDALRFEGADSRREVLEKMIDEKLILFATEQKGLKIPNVLLASAIKKLPEFQNEQGTFDVLKYKGFLVSRGLSEVQTDELIREGMQRQLLPGVIIGSSMASDVEVDSYLKLDRQTRDIRFLPIPAVVQTLAAPTAAELDGWYKKNISRYRSEENVTIEYVEFDAASLPVAETVDDATLRELYQKKINAYRTADQKMASHIYFAVAKDASATAANAALTKANNVAKLARAPGANFAALAKQYSEDEGTKDDGGDLGAVEKDLFDPAFEKAFATLQPGQVSDPVRVANGYEVIYFRETVPGEVRQFEEVRTELEAAYFEQERERILNERVTKLLDKTYDNPAAFAPTAAELGLTILRAGPFTRGNGQGLAALEPIRKAAFSDALKQSHEVSDAIEIADNQSVVLRVVDLQPAGFIPLAKIRERVLADFQVESASTIAKARAKALQGRANKAESLDNLAKEIGGQVATLPKITRNPQVPQLADVATTAFSLPLFNGKQNQVGLAKLQGGSFALVEVTAINDGDIGALDATTRENIRKQMAQARGSVEVEAFVKSLRKQFQIDIVEANLGSKNQ